ncbi:MAG: acyl-[acyl-carrier-protein]--UDP-N-acetylglucosamine O-acyltransferase [Rickettsiales bacterium]|nr:acyl-[acyl-carrier-protein]--UDP-N-acetylglucosamine O-acyltransferase [Rickettsiales bacterium]|tara:strand:- start:2151 stop:2930 length:780 start_codon:yes stop_codon:yes gene_type:complete
MIHPGAIVSSGAKISKNVKIGPFSFIGENVQIGNGCKIHSNVVIDGNVKIGENTEIFPFSSIGSIPQDLKYKGEDTKVIIGSNCKIREYVTINLGTQGGGGVTEVGDNCLLMVGTHIAHDCKIFENVIFANHSTLAGHVVIESNVVVGALSAIHQFSQIGEGAMIGGMSGVTADVIPFGTVLGNRAKLSGLNIIGLKRRDFSKDEISELRKVYKFIFHSKEKTFKNRLNEVINTNCKYYTVKKLLDFLSRNSERSFCLP